MDLSEDFRSPEIPCKKERRERLGRNGSRVLVIPKLGHFELGPNKREVGVGDVRHRRHGVSGSTGETGLRWSTGKLTSRTVVTGRSEKTQRINSKGSLLET